MKKLGRPKGSRGTNLKKQKPRELLVQEKWPNSLPKEQRIGSFFYSGNIYPICLFAFNNPIERGKAVAK